MHSHVVAFAVALGRVLTHGLSFQLWGACIALQLWEHMGDTMTILQVTGQTNHFYQQLPRVTNADRAGLAARWNVIAEGQQLAHRHCPEGRSRHTNPGPTASVDQLNESREGS